LSPVCTGLYNVVVLFAFLPLLLRLSILWPTRMYGEKA